MFREELSSKAFGSITIAICKKKPSRFNFIGLVYNREKMNSRL